MAADLSPALAQLVHELTGQLHDDGNEDSNSRRLTNLWREHAPDLGEQELAKLVLEARRRTLAAGVRKPAREGGDVGLKNRAPYLFRVLENLLRERAAAAIATPIGTGGHEDVATFITQARRRRRPGQPARPAGGQPGNQNARKHGYTSRQNPAPLDQLITDLKRATRRRDSQAIRSIARALEFHGKHRAGHRARKLAEQLERAAADE